MTVYTECLANHVTQATKRLLRAYRALLRANGALRNITRCPDANNSECVRIEQWGWQERGVIELGRWLYNANIRGRVVRFFIHHAVNGIARNDVTSAWRA